MDGGLNFSRPAKASQENFPPYCMLISTGFPFEDVTSVLRSVCDLCAINDLLDGLVLKQDGWGHMNIDH